MYAISFDLDTRELAKHHPKSVNQAYRDIANTLKKYDFKWTQGSLYTTKNEDMANVSDAIDALGAFSWFPHSVRDIRAFRVEMWSNFTPRAKRMITN